jgi:hypothetical protein
VRAELQANLALEEAGDALPVPAERGVTAPERGLPAPGF